MDHICYSNQNFVPSPPQTQNFVEIKRCPIEIVFTSTAIPKLLLRTKD